MSNIEVFNSTLCQFDSRSYVLFFRLFLTVFHTNSYFLQECKREMLSLIKKINGLIAIIITDREGVPLIKGIQQIDQTLNQN